MKVEDATIVELMFVPESTYFERTLPPLAFSKILNIVMLGLEIEQPGLDRPILDDVDSGSEDVDDERRSEPNGGVSHQK